MDARGVRLSARGAAALVAAAMLAVAAFLGGTPSESDALDPGELLAEFVTAGTDDPTGTVDPGYDKDVAWSEAAPDDSDGDGTKDRILMRIHNAYPCYETELDFTIENVGTVPGEIVSVETSAPEVLEVDHSPLEGTILDPGAQVDGTATVHVLQPAEQNWVYPFEICIELDGDSLPFTEPTPTPTAQPGGDPGAGATAAQPAEEPFLPFTGADAGIPILAACAVAFGGLVLRRLAS